MHHNSLNLSIFYLDICNATVVPAPPRRDVLAVCRGVVCAARARATEFESGHSLALGALGGRPWRAWRRFVLGTAELIGEQLANGAVVLSGDAPAPVFLDLGRRVRRSLPIVCEQYSAWRLFDLTDDDVSRYSALMRCEVVPHAYCESDERPRAALLFATTEAGVHLSRPDAKHIRDLLPELCVAHEFRLAPEKPFDVASVDDAHNIGDLRVDIIHAYTTVQESSANMRHVIIAADVAAPLAYMLGEMLTELPGYEVHVVSRAGNGAYELCW